MKILASLAAVAMLPLFPATWMVGYVICQSAIANDNVETYFREGERQRKELIGLLQDTIDQNNKMIKTLPKDRSDVRQKNKDHQPRMIGGTEAERMHLEQANKEHRELIKRWERDLVYAPQLIGPTLGALGHIYWPATVQQRIDGSSALIKVKIATSWVGSLWEGRAPTMHCEEQLMFLQGMDLSNVVDDQQIDFKLVMIVSGTKTYPNALGGSKTVYVLEPLKPDEQREIAEQALARKKAAEERENERLTRLTPEQREAEDKAKEEEAKTETEKEEEAMAVKCLPIPTWRHWTVDGHQLTAKPVKVSPQYVWLRPKDGGKIVKAPRSELKNNEKVFLVEQEKRSKVAEQARKKREEAAKQAKEVPTELH